VNGTTATFVEFLRWAADDDGVVRMSHREMAFRFGLGAQQTTAQGYERLAPRVGRMLAELRDLDLLEWWEPGVGVKLRPGDPSASVPPSTLE
jgi:hypothetical protein